MTPETTTPFTVAVEWMLQRRVLNAEIIVRMGKAKKARGFDALHNDHTIRFTLDDNYVGDPKEALDMIEKLVEWVDKWNQVEVAKRY
jgi:hypothetical protein